MQPLKFIKFYDKHILSIENLNASHPQKHLQCHAAILKLGLTTLVSFQL
jgi:hypothetical protein